jgi:hypothetical protein
MIAEPTHSDLLVVVNAFPTGAVPPEMVHWFRDQGVPHTQVWGHGMGERWYYEIGANWSVKIALDSDYDTFLFLDADMRLSDLTLPLLWSTAAVTAGQYDLGRAKAWGTKHALHSGLWKATRAALEAVERPLFMPRLRPDGLGITCCCCCGLVHRLLAAGIEPVRAGYAGHTPKLRDPHYEKACRDPRNRGVYLKAPPYYRAVEAVSDNTE